MKGAACAVLVALFPFVCGYLFGYLAFVFVMVVYLLAVVAFLGWLIEGEVKMEREMRQRHSHRPKL